ncbi:sperm-associated antigen 5-like [Uloborus diversus]|uniref:sperm-associated antigen 5-like n=1 Tax=Uloborus diversus TaxID=327109 RepID=UPI002409A6A0|nr:sperm-associated antigen 5-like [Uloborus diversus]
MPTNQPSSVGSQPPGSAPTRSNLVRSKSLRLPTTKPKTEQGSSTLSRHGSIRGPRTSTLTAAKSSLTVSKKPPVKPKPSFCSSKSNENLENSSSRNAHSADDSKKLPYSCRSPVKQADGRGVSFTEKHLTPSSSPTSLQSDKSQSQEGSSWCTSDLAVHLKRLTEEHEKLQVEYARLRMQLIENSSFHPVSQLRRDQHLSHSDSHLSSIPENSPDGDCVLSKEQTLFQAQETLVQNLRTEIFRLQEENKKLQRKYWEQILNSELLEDEPCNGASEQVVVLMDKLDDKEKELLDATGKVQELENHLATTNLELQQCHDALQDQQHMLEDLGCQKVDLIKHLQECRSALSEARENIDFLQDERTTLAEALQEAEQSLSEVKAEMRKDQEQVNELMDRARRLYAKVKDKNLQVQLLQAELDRTQGNCRDMLLSQGAELTMISMHLSQMSMSIHSLLTSAAEFAANELALQKEMLEDVMADLDSEGERSDSPPKQTILSSDSHIPNSIALSSTSSLSSDKYVDAHKSLPDISNYEPSSPLYSSASSNCDRPVSFVQSMVRTYEQSAKSESKSKHTSEHNSDSVKSSIENLSSINGDLSRISSPSKESSPVMNNAFKPIGMATAFRPVRQRSVETDIIPTDTMTYEEEKKSSFEKQLKQMDQLIKKFGKVIELMQGKYLSKIKLLNEEKNNALEELRSFKNKHYELKADFDIRKHVIDKGNDKAKVLAEELEKNKKKHEEEKEKLGQTITELNEKLCCLEAVNAEQSQQISNEVKQMITMVVTDSNCEFLSNAQAICDKLNYKQEIAKLKAKINEKDQLLRQLAQKFTKTSASLEENLHKTEKEVSVLDNVIQEVFIILQRNPTLIETHESLKELYSLVSGNCTLSGIDSFVKTNDENV